VKSEKMKFICDEMLKGLGRWLRAAGYDTLIATNDYTDRQLIEQARSESRWVISRDRKLMEFRNADNCVILLQGNAIPECVCELNRRLQLNWTLKPFSRCLLCNTRLIDADPQLKQQVPPRSRAIVTSLYWCEHCQKLYWNGGHVKRMLATLERWDAVCRENE
jgi:uncharacterized protein with PIN domain